MVRNRQQPLDGKSCKICYNIQARRRHGRVLRRTTSEILTKTTKNTAKMEIDKIYNMDCLLGVTHIPDGSIDAIICDLP
jgi:hypothetical protein